MQYLTNIFYSLTNLLGGWDVFLESLVILMIIDYITGLFCALIFKKSPKTEDGSYDSKIGLKGIIYKIGILMIVLISDRIDVMLFNNEHVCKAVISFFIVHEGLSIIENWGIMGLPLPSFIKDAFNSLNNKSDSKE